MHAGGVQGTGARCAGSSAAAHQPMLALMNWMSSRMIMSSQLPMAASTSTASQIMMGIGMTSCMRPQ